MGNAAFAVCRYDARTGMPEIDRGSAVAFFIGCSIGHSRYRFPRAQERDRINDDAVFAQLKMQVRAGGSAGFSHKPDALPLIDPVALRDKLLALMGVVGFVAVFMVDHGKIAVAVVPACEADHTAVGGDDNVPCFPVDVQSRVVGLLAEDLPGLRSPR